MLKKLLCDAPFSLCTFLPLVSLKDVPLPAMETHEIHQRLLDPIFHQHKDAINVKTDTPRLKARPDTISHCFNTIDNEFERYKDVTTVF